MSYRELSAMDVRELLRRWQSGQSARAMARDAIADRKTAGRYIDAAAKCAVGLTTELTDDIVQRVVAHVQGRPQPPRSEQRQLLEQHRLRIEAWLHGGALELTRVHALLCRDGVNVSYTTLRRYARAHLGHGATRE